MARRELRAQLVDLSWLEEGGLAHCCWLTVVHSCLHSGSVKHSVPDLTEDLTRLQDRPEEKICGTALDRLRQVSRVIITTGRRGELRVRLRGEEAFKKAPI